MKFAFSLQSLSIVNILWTWKLDKPEKPVMSKSSLCFNNKNKYYEYYINTLNITALSIILFSVALSSFTCTSMSMKRLNFASILANLPLVTKMNGDKECERLA